MTVSIIIFLFFFSFFMLSTQLTDSCLPRKPIFSIYPLNMMCCFYKIYRNLGKSFASIACMLMQNITSGSLLEPLFFYIEFITKSYAPAWGDYSSFMNIVKDHLNSIFMNCTFWQIWTQKHHKSWKKKNLAQVLMKSGTPEARLILIKMTLFLKKIINNRIFNRFWWFWYQNLRF